MLETPVLLQNSSEGGGGGAAAAELKKNNEGGGEDGEWNSGGNRWPHEETLALLNIRSQMDLAFRDSSSSSSSSHKAPLWDEVSRKMGELGYHRNAKKCKEKFDNIYKYHKRTKEGRSGRRQNAKNYRFFQQLELFDTHHSLLPSPTSHQIQNTLEKPTLVSPATPLAMLKPTASLSQDDLRTQQPCHTRGDFSLDVNSTSTSATSSSSGKESEGIAKKKRKLGDYFDKLMKKVLEKQEGLHSKFLEAIEKCEKDRMAREEAWKRQEMERLKREQESITEERAIAAAKDAAIIAFLQKITQQPIPVPLPMNPTPISSKCVENQEIVLEKNIGDGSEDVVEKGNDTQENVGERSSVEKREKGGCGESNSLQTSSSRWPREEVEALVRVRTNLDLQYQDNGSKGPLWEEISAGMKKFGYDRSAKRCKEKWENINKYYRRVKETQKKRPEDSKTCPYFHLLDSLYQSKSRRVEHRRSDVPKSKGEMLVQIMRQNQEEEEATGKEDGKRPSVDQNEENDDEYHQIVGNPRLPAAEKRM